MNLNHILSDLRDELKQINQVILVLERLATARTKREGRARRPSVASTGRKQKRRKPRPIA